MKRLAILAALLLLSAGTARAQGTAEQREACAPDAIRLCSDTIPDVERTRACMQRHEAELSPRCHALFAAATPAPAPAERRRRAENYPYSAPDDLYEQAPVHYRRSHDPYDYTYADDAARARAVIAHVCEDDVIDARTCAVIDRALREQEYAR